MRTTLNIFLTLIIVFFSSCEEKNPEYLSSFFFENSTITHSLDGVWDNGQVKIIFDGDNAVFYEIKSGSWLTAMSSGLVDIGTIKIKGLKKESALVWSCNELVLPGDNISGAKGVEWNANGKINMSMDGNSITITSSNLTMFTSTYTKSTNNAIVGYPQLGTSLLLSVIANSATLYSSIFSDGGKAVTHRGVCWNTTVNPTVNNKKTDDGSGKGFFNSSMSELIANTTYYIKAYATNENGTSYSDQVTLITLPIVNNGVSSKVSYNTATISGAIPSQGNSAISAYGHCWNTSSNPTIDNSKIISTDLNAGNFNSVLSGLQANTKYYVRAFITNSSGTSYSNEITFNTTNAILPTVTIGTISGLTYNSVTVEGKITVLGDLPIIEYGHCWSTTTSPTISNNKLATTNLSSGSFSTALTGLNQSTKYYVRAYTTTSFGTNYSSEATFTTSADPYIISDGLLAYYNFNSQNANDALGNFNGAISGGVTYSSTTPNSSGYAAQFDGSTGYINIQNQILPSSGSWTYSLWVKTNKNSIGLIESGNKYICIDPSSNLYALIYLNPYSFTTGLSSTLLNNNWHQLTVVYTESSLKYYIDGSLNGNISGSYGSWGSVNYTKIGNNPNYNGVTKFSGLMDNIRFYNRALTTTEITTLYNAKQ
jgi:hypothetical protein